MTEPTLYDRIGQSYVASRAADPRIVAEIMRLLDLPAGAVIADIGAGTGNYANALAAEGYRVEAIEPSATMRDQAAAHPGVTWHAGTAEAIPLPDRSVDGCVAVLAIHHFRALEAALAEMRRIAVGGPIVVFTFDPREGQPFWFGEYFPEIEQQDFEIFPPIAEIVAALAEQADEAPQVTVFPLPDDLRDRFMLAGWNRPELYFDPTFRANTSGFAKADPATVERGLARLREDVTSGAWDVRHGDMRTMASFDAGYRFVSCRMRG
ncbi:MAG: class I SAM-dependent methyltransferase [Alphaproteobacteria bacterium]